MKAYALIIFAVALTACTPAKFTPEADRTASAESASASELAREAVLLPDGFTGRWDASVAACKATSDMKLIVTQSEITFWESSGRISGVTVNGPGDVIVKAAFSGESEQWQRDLNLVLNNKGDTLTIDGTPRVRCP